MTSQHGPVGMVGVGNMGGRMARRMAEAGYDVRAVDADPARIPASGAKPAGSLAALAAGCDVIMLSLPDSPVIESVIRGPDGLLAHARPGQVIVDLSTANPASTRALHAELAAKGTRFLDAGISGGVPTLVGPGTPTAFQVSSALGYGDVISNRVVDAYGDLAGGVRVTQKEGSM